MENIIENILAENEKMQIQDNSMHSENSIDDFYARSPRNEKEFSDISAIEEENKNDFNNSKDEMQKICIKIRRRSKTETNLMLPTSIQDHTLSLLKGKRKKRHKEDLDKTPLPLFDCIYCSGEKVVFQHMIQDNLSRNYLYNSSIWDIKKIECLFNSPWVLSNRLAKFVIEHSDFIKKLYSSTDSTTFFQGGYFKHMCLLQSLSMPSKKVFSFFQIAPSGCEYNTPSHLKSFHNHKAIKEISKSNIEFPANNLHCSNFNSNSLNFIDDSQFKKNIPQPKANERNKIREDITAEDDFGKNVTFLNFLKFDLRRKIKKEDISWDSEEHDIWDPKNSDIGLSTVNEKMDQVCLSKIMPCENSSAQFSNNSVCEANSNQHHFSINNCSNDPNLCKSYSITNREGHYLPSLNDSVSIFTRPKTQTKAIIINMPQKIGIKELPPFSPTMQTYCFKFKHDNKADELEQLQLYNSTKKSLLKFSKVICSTKKISSSNIIHNSNQFTSLTKSSSGSINMTHNVGSFFNNTHGISISMSNNINTSYSIKKSPRNVLSAFPYIKKPNEMGRVPVVKKTVSANAMLSTGRKKEMH